MVPMSFCFCDFPFLGDGALALTWRWILPGTLPIPRMHSVSRLRSRRKLYSRGGFLVFSLGASGCSLGLSKRRLISACR